MTRSPTEPDAPDSDPSGFDPDGSDPSDPMTFLGRAEVAGRFFENTILVSILSAMILLGGAQIFLRNFAGTTLIWADEALRLMVLWIALFGAVAASRDDRHITIDVLARILSPDKQRWVAAVVNLFTALVALTLAWYSLEFVMSSYEFEDQVLGDYPAWAFQAALPIAFGLIGYRYSIWFLRRLRSADAQVGKS